MISIPVYLRLYRLQASNKQLLKMYYFLYYNISGEESSFYKREFSQRISRREKINQELETHIKENRNSKEGSLLSRFIDLSFPVIFSLDYIIQGMFFSPNLDRCQTLEIRNIEMYYDILYAGAKPEIITDLMLDQKSEIEDYVLIEI